MPPQTRLAALALAWLLLASVGLTPLAPAAATHAGNAGTNTINDCQAIDQSGTYTLTGGFETLIREGYVQRVEPTGWRVVGEEPASVSA